MASWLPTYINIHMLCYGECFLCLVMYSTDYTYLCCIGYIIFIGANRFGPGQKNLGKG